jgi:hypothetical protein
MGGIELSVKGHHLGRFICPDVSMALNLAGHPPTDNAIADGRSILKPQLLRDVQLVLNGFPESDLTHCPTRRRCMNAFRFLWLKDVIYLSASPRHTTFSPVHRFVSKDSFQSSKSSRRNKSQHSPSIAKSHHQPLTPGITPLSPITSGNTG